MRASVACAMAGALLLLPGCTDSDSADTAAPRSESHTMPDGSVMEGATHVHADGHDHGSAAAEPRPSEAARMVCTGQVVEDVARILDLPSEATPSSAWEPPVFTCRFDLDVGPLTLSVHDATDRASGMAHFQGERISSTDARPIRGVYSLGLPAYETSAGIVSFVKDGKTLEVDASGLSGERLGVEDSRTPSEIAYAVATSVLACWTEHS